MCAGEFPVLPHRLLLQPLGQVQLLVLRQDRREDKLGDRPVEDAVGVRQNHIRTAEVLKEHGVHAGGCHMDPFQRIGVGPGIGQRGGEKVPEEQHLGSRQCSRQAGGVGDPHVCQGLDLRQIHRQRLAGSR